MITGIYLFELPLSTAFVGFLSVDLSVSSGQYYLELKTSLNALI
jgi:hypothetical protein